MSFALDLRRLTTKANDKLERTARVIVIELGRRIVEKSPVGNPELWAVNNTASKKIAKQYNADVAEWNANLRTSPDNLTKNGRLKRGLKINDSMDYKVAAPAGYVGGRFRGNWQYGFGAMPSSELDTVDPSGRASLQRITSGVNGAPAAGLHYLVNNLPYAQRLEDGWSQQAPSGMVGLTVLEFRSIVEGAAK